MYNKNVYACTTFRIWTTYWYSFRYVGLNAVKFCKEFNDFTKDLPSYFVLKVTLKILEDRSFTFTVAAPSTGFLLNLLKFDRIFLVSGHKVTKSCLSLKSLVQLSIFKFSKLSLKKAVYTVCGTLNSANIIVI